VFIKLSASSIKKWCDLEKLFLARFFKEEMKISMVTLLSMKKKK